MKRKLPHPPRESHPALWRSFAELENTPEFAQVVEREFPGGIEKNSSGLTKRDFVKLMGASVALTALTGCRRPEAQLVPFTKGVEWSVPGKFLYYATAMPTRGGAMPLVASTVDGRPTKLEGNPLHPASNGATDAFAQASVLDLYDPHRSRTVKCGGREVVTGEFEAYLARLSEKRPEGLAFLVERKNSPTRDRLRGELEQRFPGLIWSEYEPLGDDREAVTAAFGAGVRVVPKFERADVILALDSDFLSSASEYGPGYAAGFYPRRNPDQLGAPMNRLYVVENHYTCTGGMADHRYRCKASLVGEFTRRLATRIVELTNHPGLATVLGAAPQTKADFDEKWIAECAADLARNPGRGLVLAGNQQPAWVQALVFGINEALGNHGMTILGVADDAPPTAPLGQLVEAIRAGAVKTLFILGGNPAYNAPANFALRNLLTHVPEVVRVGMFEDETSAVSEWHVPAAHYLEAWGDARTFDGTYTPIQPMILPLWGGVSELEILARLGGNAQPSGLDLVRQTYGLLSGAAAHEGWSEFLRDGFLPGSQAAARDLAFRANEAVRLTESAAPIEEGIELVFLQSSSVDDGRYANNSWLQETPDFETKVTWDNVALVSPATAARLGIRANNFGLLQKVTALNHEVDFDMVADLITLNAGDVAIEAAAIVAPGHADDSISLALGYGRKGVSALFDNVGFDAYPLRTSDSPRFRTGIAVSGTGRTYPLARTQEHKSMEGRDLFREGTRERYKKDPKFVQSMGLVDAHNPPTTSLYEHPRLTAPEQWGMVIDLNTCIGCSACAVACQAENNVPVVGKAEVRRNRDMAWMRIDRYFAGNPDNPEMLAQAMLCQHCENAPCESVCPVNATVHSEEGLNLMAYNRCIGTRYCANNCPWKVRRFNYFDYNQRPLEELYWGPLAPKGMADSLKMVKNPNVTVRMRGVMEKCTFCIQRIEEAKISRMVQAGPRNKYEVPVPKFQTACQQACPSDSIVFGNIADPKDRVTRLRQSERGYVTLKYLNTQPRVTYLARIKNPNPAMPDAAMVGMANGPGGGHH